LPLDGKTQGALRSKQRRRTCRAPSSSGARLRGSAVLEETVQAVEDHVETEEELGVSAALILGLAFVAMSTGPGTEAKMFATALGGGVPLDATLIRGVLAPAVVALLGRWNWWLPSRAARVLRLAPKPAPA
jgi:RND superfamily putative drug exporter